MSNIAAAMMTARLGLVNFYGPSGRVGAQATVSGGDKAAGFKWG